MATLGKQLSCRMKRTKERIAFVKCVCQCQGYKSADLLGLCDKRCGAQTAVQIAKAVDLKNKMST